MQIKILWWDDQNGLNSIPVLIDKIIELFNLWGISVGWSIVEAAVTFSFYWAVVLSGFSCCRFSYKVKRNIFSMLSLNKLVNNFCFSLFLTDNSINDLLQRACKLFLFIFFPIKTFEKWMFFNLLHIFVPNSFCSF